MWDRRWSVLKSLPQVVLTPHSAFLTREALANIADATVRGRLRRGRLGGGAGQGAVYCRRPQPSARGAGLSPLCAHPRQVGNLREAAEGLTLTNEVKPRPKQ